MASKTPINRAELELIGEMLMKTLGVERTASTAETPARWAKWWVEFLEYDDSKTMTTFTSEAIDQLVVVSGIRVWSICEHHLLPFYCDVSMAYITRDRVLGLSKFARIAHLHAHRLNVQERLVSDIAQHLHEATNSPDVGVIAQGEHLCMTMRGIKSPAVMTSSAMHGLFRTDIAARTEFLRIAKIGG